MPWQEKASDNLQAAFPSGSRLLVAVSGGPDSMALAHFLRGQPYAIVIGHVNHRLRKGSAADARFVETMARQWDLPCAVQSVDVSRYAASHQTGIEQAARDLRYRILAQMARRFRCAGIVTAHTANDQSETVLMNFLRGSGPTGLAGIPPVRLLESGRSLRVARPFLDVARDQIMRYLRDNGLSFRKDPSNDSLRFARNRIRHSTLPYLEKLYPGVANRLVQMADIFRQEEDYWCKRLSAELHKTVRKNGSRITVVLPRLLRYHKTLSRRILRHVFPGLSFQDIEQVLMLARSAEGSAWVLLPGCWQIKRTKKLLVAIKKRFG